jgi:hypothetical protein
MSSRGTRLLSAKELATREKKDYYESRWLSQQVMKGKIQVAPHKLELLKETFPHIFNPPKPPTLPP